MNNMYIPIIKLKIILSCLVLTSFLAPLTAFATTKELTVRITKDAPRQDILQKHFILVGDAELPPHFSKIRSQWHDILNKHEENIFDVTNIPLPAQHKEQWANLTKLLPKMDGAKKLRKINGFFNHIPSRDDAYTYKTKEYWATPAEFLQERAGDCEDYALTKYFALKYFSWPSDDLWVIFLRDNINQGMHVVLAARHQERVFILDNLSKPEYLLIPESQYAKQVNVVALFNDAGMWLPIKK